jgi:glyoxylase-like metal-dependent hydrolase (beta-lactamase superfamily II)
MKSLKQACGQDPPSAELEVVGTVQHRAWIERSHPPVEHLGSGVWSIPVPMPDHPLRYVNCYVIESRQGPVLVDPGWPAGASIDHLTAGLRTIGCELSEVHGILVTHGHTDHVGIAGHLREVSGCWISMHAADAELVRTMQDGSTSGHRNATWMDLCGVPSAERAAMSFTPDSFAWTNDAEPDRLIADASDCGVPARSVVAQWTPGHTPGHLCFTLPAEGMLLTGDMVLPRITPHVGSNADGLRPLANFLASLDALLSMPADIQVLPGHEYRFRGLRARVDALRRHHEHRTAEVVDVILEAGAGTAWDIATRLTWSRSWAETTGTRRRLAVAETLAHLEWLEQQVRVSRTGQVPAVWYPMGCRQA